MPRLFGYAIVAVVLLVAGGLGAHHFTTAGASSPFPAHDTDINWDGQVNAIDVGGVRANFGQVAVGARPVAEQNLDGDGNIKVHEQGIVQVNVLAEPGTTTLILDADHGGGTAYTDFVNVENCESMILLAERSASLYFDNKIAYIASHDGVTGYGVVPASNAPIIDQATPGYTEWVSVATSRAYLDVSKHNVGTPYMQFGIPSGAQHLTIRLYCG